MAFEKFEDIEGAGLLALALVFTIWEWRFPARRVDRRVDLKRDLLALGMLVLAVNLSRFGLHALFRGVGAGPAFADAPWNHAPFWARLVIAMVLSDLCLYWLHRLLHTGALWNSHKWHHSIEQMWWFAGLRTSAVHAFIYAIPQVLIAFYLVTFTPMQQGLAFSVGIFFQYFTHANVRANLGPLEWLFITPRYHRLHHAASDRLQHGNYGTAFAIWDRLFGTYVDPRALHDDVTVGLGEPAKTSRMLVGL